MGEAKNIYFTCLKEEGRDRRKKTGFKDNLAADLISR